MFIEQSTPLGGKTIAIRASRRASKDHVFLRVGGNARIRREGESASLDQDGRGQSLNSQSGSVDRA